MVFSFEKEPTDDTIFSIDIYMKTLSIFMQMFSALYLVLEKAPRPVRFLGSTCQEFYLSG